MGNTRCRNRSSAILITALSLATVLSSCYPLEASFLPSSSSSHLAMMRRNVARPPKLPASVLILKGGSDEEEAQPQPPQDPEIQQEEVALEATLEEPPAPPATTMIAGGEPGPFRRSFPNLPYHKFPDYLTYMRCAAIPLLCWTFYTPGKHVECGVIFALASFTDWLDGFLARRWEVSTAFGAFLDPVADKLMVSTALVLLSGRHGALVALPTCVILARELAVSALREWMAQRGQRDTVKVGMQGKVKTALTMVSLTLMLLVPEIVGNSWLGNLFLPSLAALYVCSVITVTSGAVYFKAAAPYLMGKS